MLTQLPLSPVSDDFFETQQYWLSEPSKELASLSPTTMREYPTPSRTPQADNSLLSGPSTPTPSPHGLGIVDLDFSTGGIVTNFTPSTQSATPVSAHSQYWPEMSMIPTSSTGQSLYSHLSPGSYIPTCSAEAQTFYSPIPAPSPYPVFRSIPRSDFPDNALHRDPYHYPTHYDMLQSPPNERQGWMSSEVDMNISRVGLLSSRNGRTPSVSPSTSMNPAVFSSQPSPMDSFSGSRPSTTSTSLPMRPNTIESTGRKYFPLASNRRLSKVQKRDSSSERRYICSTCKRGFKKHSNLKDHEQKHDTNRLPPYPCTYEDCDKRLGRKTDLARHISAVHKNEKAFVCAKCKKGFGRKDTLSR